MDSKSRSPVSAPLSRELADAAPDGHQWLHEIKYATQQVYQMARAAGLNKEDGSSIIKVFERMTGMTIGGDDD